MKGTDVALLAVLALLIVSGGGSGAAAVFSSGRKKRVTPEEKEAVLKAFESRGFPRDEAAMVVRLESGWRPDAMNPSTRAVGLIQFMPAILRALQYSGTPEDFARLSAAEQAPWIAKFLRSTRWAVPGDTYLAIAAPAYIGAPDHLIVYRKGTPAWKLNPGLRSANDGDITAGSIRWTLLKRMPAKFEP